MTRTKQAARNGNFSKRPTKGNQADGPPPSKKAKKNPPPSSTSLDSSNAARTRPPPTSNIAAPQIATASTTNQSLNTVPSEPISQSHNILPSEPTHQADNAAPSVPPTSATYDTTGMSIISSSNIQQKVTRALEVLGSYEKGKTKVAQVLMLHAKAPCAAKMISIAEIAKREISKEGGKWFQYNKVESVMVEAKEDVKKADRDKDKGKVGGEEKDGEGGGGGGWEEMGSDEEATAFETMKTPFERANEGVPKMRAMPVMTLYLSRVRIDNLRKAYGEQTNALPPQKEKD